MKELVYNHNNLKESDINRFSRRAKAIIKNSKNQILLACVNGNYHLPGGHLEGNESYEECLERELKEEVGVNLNLKLDNPILTIIYYNKNYPEVGINSKSIAKYFEIKEEIVPNYYNIHLTDEEKKGNFKLEYFDEALILDHLNESLKTCTRVGVVKDTIEVIKEYLKRR